MVDLVAPTVEQLISQLMPWLGLGLDSSVIEPSSSSASPHSQLISPQSSSSVVLPPPSAPPSLRVSVPLSIRGGSPSVEPISSITVSPSVSLVGFWRDNPVFAEFLMAVHSSLTSTPSGCPVFQPAVVGLKPAQWAISTTSLRIWISSSKSWEIQHLFTMPEISYLQTLSITGNVYFTVRK